MGEESWKGRGKEATSKTWLISKGSGPASTSFIVLSPKSTHSEDQGAITVGCPTHQVVWSWTNPNLGTLALKSLFHIFTSSDRLRRLGNILQKLGDIRRKWITCWQAPDPAWPSVPFHGLLLTELTHVFRYISISFIPIKPEGLRSTHLL